MRGVALPSGRGPATVDRESRIGSALLASGFIPGRVVHPSVGFNILVGIGIAAGVWTFDHLNRRPTAAPRLAKSADRAIIAMVCASLAAFGGAVALSALAEGRVPFVQPWSFTFLGGLLGGVAVLPIAASLLRVPLAQLLDHAAIGLCVGHSIGRLGCLWAGCCHGVACGDTSFLGWLAPVFDRVPVQLFESLAEAANAVVLLVLVRRPNHRAGIAALAWSALYGTERLALEALRGDERGSLPFASELGLSPSQGICILLIVVAGIGALALRLRANRECAAE